MNNMNNIDLEDKLQQLSVALGYQTLGVNAYYELTKETENVKKQYDEKVKEYGKEKTEKILILSKIDILEDFLVLKNLKKEDETILIYELYKEAKKLYNLKGEL